MAGTRRTSNITAEIEYKLVQKIRTSNITLQVEYAPDQRIKTSLIALMVEYKPFLAAPRILGPAIQTM